MIGGKAGYGIMATGLIFARTCSRSGLHVFANVEYPSLIRGGHNTYHIRAEEEEIHSHVDMIDILVALNKETIDKHKDRLTQGAAVIYDSEDTQPEGLREDIQLYDIPLLSIAKEKGMKVMRNTVALGATMALLGTDLEILRKAIEDNFSDKGKEMAQKNIDAAGAGYDHMKRLETEFKIKLEKKESSPRMLLSGNEAISMGAIRAGCKLYAAYPMTPASSILHYMAAHENDKGIVVKQTEDEIAAIHTAIGASFAGVRSMAATSGGGFCLMTEGLSLAGILEVPLVLVECQRPGPSTGLATRTEQGDLRFVMHASQGEFTRAVIAPGDVTECYHLTAQAFNLADRHQAPVIILSDKHLSETSRTAEPFDTSYTTERGKIAVGKSLAEGKRFQVTDDGTATRALPGQGDMFRTPSYEHDEHGWNDENPNMRTVMVDRRVRKAEAMLKDIPDPKEYGPEDADLTIVGWGSTKGAILEAMKLLEKDGLKTNYVQVTHILPFKKEKIKEMLSKAKKLMIVEQNRTLQLAGVIKENTGIKMDHQLAKYSGRQVMPHEIYEKAKAALEEGR